MISTNPFFILSESVPAILMQSFVILMGILIQVGTVMVIIHKKNFNTFSKMQKKQNCQLKKN